MLDKTVSIYRLSAIDQNKSSYTTFTTTIQATIQPLGEQKASMLGGSHGEMFVIYMDVDKGIKENDQIRDFQGNIYKVIGGGIKNRNDGFVADYLEITVQKIS